MPPKTVTCVVCGQEVSKRKTLLIEGGRACRDHDEVRAWEELRKLESDMAEVGESLRVMVLAAGVRTTHSLARTPVETLYGRISSRWGLSTAESVRRKVDEHGGPLMTAVELSSVIADGLMMRARMAKLEKEMEG